jgi:hypothetical protein
VRLGASFLLSLALAAFVALPSSADTIQLGINGDAQVGSNYIDFGQFPTGAPYTPAPGYGTFEVSLVNSGVFSTAGVTAGEMGKIQSLNEPTGMQPCPSATNGLCNGAFMTFNGGGSNLQLWATNIPDGGEGAGPFVLTDTADGAVVSFNVDGYIWDTNTMSKVDTFTGTFSATFDGQSVASLFTSLPINTPFSATFTATTIPVTGVPEPASMLLMCAGLLGVGLLSRRKTRKS